MFFIRGIGYGIADRIIAEGLGSALAPKSSQRSFTLVLACRNMKKATIARESLISKYFPSDKDAGLDAIQLLECNLSDCESVLKATKEFKMRYRLD